MRTSAEYYNYLIKLLEYNSLTEEEKNCIIHVINLIISEK